MSITGSTSGDIPPVPKCFSHLIPHDYISSYVANTSREGAYQEDFASTPDSAFQTDFEHLNNVGFRSESGFGSGELETNSSSFSTEESPQQSPHRHQYEDESSCRESELPSTSAHNSFNAVRSFGGLSKNPETLKELADQSVPTLSSQSTDSGNNPFTKLNCSLSKLQKEMQDLRYMDISIFYQLSSLQESIQEFKTDRYSETGSEYSLGSASYMGSMSSLNEDIEALDDDVDRAQREASAGEASSLLQQISDLALRVDEDF